MWLGRSKGFGEGEQREREKFLHEAGQLKMLSLPVLDGLFKGGFPDYLAGVTDKMTLFDSIQPGFEGRWTGRKLLPAVQKAKGRATRE